MSWLCAVSADHPSFRASKWNDATWQHRAVMGLFGRVAGNGEQGPRERLQVLYRVDQLAGGRTHVLVQAAQPPSDPAIPKRSLDPVWEWMRTRPAVRFELVANPVRSVNRTVDGRERKRHEPIPASDLGAWVAEKMRGFNVEHVERRAHYWLRRGNARILAVRLAGVAEVVEPDEAASVIQSGVGRARAYGCGLVTVAPMQ